MINGYYKSFCETVYNLDTVDNEYVIDLQQSKTLHTVFVGGWVWDYLTRKYWYGKVEIRLGDDSGAYNSVNSVVWPESFDGGFFPIGTSTSGQYLTFRRIYLPPSISLDESFALSEIRVY